jgi:hypothetical protein
MELRGTRRRTIIAWIFAMLCGVVLVGSGPVAMAADNSAPAMDKDAFKKGCEEGGNSYVENSDGSFQCNLKDGGVIKCPDTKSQCSYTPPLRRVGSIRVPPPADLAGFLAVPADGSGPGGDVPTPPAVHKHHKHGGR